MSSETPAQGRGSADARNVEGDSTATGGHGVEVLTAKQRARYSSMTVAGILAVPPATSQAFHLSTSIGKGIRSDGTFESFRRSDDVLAVEIRPSHRDKVMSLLELSPQAWRRYVRQWEEVRMAHRCSDLARGRVVLFLKPESICPVCGAFTTRTVERSSGERSAFMQSTQNVLRAGDASGDEEGDAENRQSLEVEVSRTSSEGSSEIAALEALKRAGAKIGEPRWYLETDEIGEPLSDEEIRELGFVRTRKGWVPQKVANDAA